MFRKFVNVRNDELKNVNTIASATRLRNVPKLPTNNFLKEKLRFSVMTFYLPFVVIFVSNADSLISSLFSSPVI